VSLRARVALAVAVVVAVVVTVVGVSVYQSTRDELFSQIDHDLTTRAAQVSRQPRGFARPGPDRFQRGSRVGRNDPFGGIVAFDVLARIVDSDANVILTLGPTFGIEPDPAVLLAAVSGPVITTQRGSAGAIRTVTVPAPGGNFVELARPLSETESVLGAMRSRILLIGLLATTAAALAAWFIARRTVRPITRLTEAAERVAATGDLAHPVDGAGGDEVGRLAGSFNGMLEALSESRRQQRRLVMDASHELRTPLTSLRTNVDVLGRGRDLTPEQHRAVVSDIDAELGELTELVTELVDLASDLRDDEDLQLVSLAELAGPVAERTQRRTGRAIEVRVLRSEVVEGRPEALSRAIRNLIDNAAKFSPDRSAVVVEVDGGAVTVHDSGPGIPLGERVRVFDRFHRVESTRSMPGSGLGLAIVRQVAESHGGRVAAGDSPLGGAAVGFEIPTVDP